MSFENRDALESKIFEILRHCWCFHQQPKLVNEQIKRRLKSDVPIFFVVPNTSGSFPPIEISHKTLHS